VDDYSLGLALFDYIPVVLSALGLAMLAQLLGSALPASRAAIRAGVVLVIAGGLSKASWKLIWVLTGTDIRILSNLLFILMAPGMILLACHVQAAGRYWRGGAATSPARGAILLIIASLGLAAAMAIGQSGSKTWFFILLGTASLANIFMSALLIRQSWQLGARGSAALFLLSIAVILSLSGLSRISEGSAPLQWLAECLNALAHGSFALAVWRLRPVILSPASAVEPLSTIKTDTIHD
jgi:hypothetical protein